MKLPHAKPEKQTKADKALILAALQGLKKKFSNRKWFAWVGQGEDEEGKFVLLVASKTKPTIRRVNSCFEYMGMPVIIAGPTR